MKPKSRVRDVTLWMFDQAQYWAMPELNLNRTWNTRYKHNFYLWRFTTFAFAFFFVGRVMCGDYFGSLKQLRSPDTYYFVSNLLLQLLWKIWFLYENTFRWGFRNVCGTLWGINVEVSVNHICFSWPEPRCPLWYCHLLLPINFCQNNVKGTVCRIWIWI